MEVKVAAMLIGAFFTLVAGVSLVLALHPKVLDGFIIRLGFSLVTIGFGASGLHLLDTSLDNVYGLQASTATGTFGLLFVLLGYILRVALAGHHLRRKADWFVGVTREEENYANCQKRS